MYYDTPSVGPYINFLTKYRFLLIAFIFALGSGALLLINPSLFSSDERIWLQDSAELKRTQSQELALKYVTKITLHVPYIDAEAIKTFKALEKRLLESKGAGHISSLLSQRHFYNDKLAADSQLLKVIKPDRLTEEELSQFLQSFSDINKAYVDLENKIFIVYVFSEESFDAGRLALEFPIDIEQISSADEKWEYLFFALVSALIILLLFRLIFQSFAASITAVSIIGLTLVFSAAAVQMLLPNVTIHIAMSLIIVSISLLDYLYFYYRWHVSQYNSNPKRALTKSLDRNLKPAFWTTIITVVGLLPLLLIDSDVISVLCLSAIFASTIAYLLNITLLPAMLSFFHVEHPKVSYGRYCYYFANKELHYKRNYLYFFIALSMIVISFVAYSFLNEPNRFISNHNSHNVISFEVSYDELDTDTIEALYRLEHLLEYKFESIENIESIATSVDKLLDIKESNLPINAETLHEALFFIQIYGLGEKLIKAKSLPVTIMLKKNSKQKADILKYLSSYEPLQIYFNDVDTLISIVKMQNSQLLLFTVVTAVLIIAFFMGYIFRNIYMVVVAFLASTIPMAWFSFGMYMLHLPFTLEVLIAMIISLGLASDATIHFAYKYWRARFFGRTKKHSLEIVFFYGAVPVIIGSLVLAVTFYGLSFSSLLTFQLIGEYSAVLIMMSLAVDLFVLPILLLVIDKYLQESIRHIKE
jgi:predicted RND superfamily exporter protein